MSGDTCETIEITRRIKAPVSDLFRIVTDPQMHWQLDGSEMLRGVATDQVVSGVGDVFIMNMFFHVFGEYQMDNHVVEFEQDRRVIWEPQAGAGHPNVGTRMGHRWGYQLEPDGDDATIVTEFYDCSRAPKDFREQMQNGAIWIPAMEETMTHLEEMVSKG
jgi:uncharacterized protein YndB with AHSA1/START domain